MFTDKDDDFIELNLQTTHYLGRPEVVEGFLGVVQEHDSIYLPEHWDTEDREHLRHIFSNVTSELLRTEWLSDGSWKLMCFSRRKPTAVDMWLNIEQGSHVKFNDFNACLDQNYFREARQEHELLSFAINIGRVIRADYGYIAHAQQRRRQSHVLTPAERLPGIYWANFFGRPYIDFFGREKLLATPCHEVREISDNLIVLLTAEKLMAPEMLERDDVVAGVKSYLNQNAFAGPNFPEEKCAVPAFDFSELRPIDEQKQSAEESLRGLREKLLAQGSELIEETDDRLVLRNTEGFVILVDKRSKEVSVDATGQYPLSRK